MPDLRRWIFLLALLPALAAATAAERIDLDSGPLKLALELDGTALRLSRLSGAEGRNRLTRITAEESSLWRLTCVKQADLELTGWRKNEAALTFTDADAAGCELVRADGLNAEFRWLVPYEDKQIAVTATISLREGDPLSRWRLAVEMPAGLSLESADFPVIPNLDIDGLRLAWPAGQGWECDMEILQRRIAGNYPGAFMQMQFYAFYRDGRGTYFAAHDTDDYHKVFQTYANDPVSGTARCEHVLVREDVSEPYAWQMPYDMVLGVYAGGFYEGAQIYRDFVRSESPWWDRAKRAFDNAPQIVKDLDVVVQADFKGDLMGVMVDRQIRFQEYFDDEPIGVWWWHWNRGTHLEGENRSRPWHFYPFMYPPVYDWKAGVAELQAHGMVVLPYIDPMLVIMSGPDGDEWEGYGPEGWYASSVKVENGRTPWRKSYNRYPKFRYMNQPCPGTPRTYKRVYEHMIRPMIEEYGLNGIYLDELGGVWPHRCYDQRTHEHPPGGGNWFHKGIRREMAYFREQTPQTVWLTENISDCLLGSFDMFLWVSVKTTHLRAIRREIPLFPAVYADRSRPVGLRLMLTPETDKVPRIFRYQAAKTLLFGAKFGGCHTGYLMKSHNLESLNLLRQLVRCRRTARAYLEDGRCLGLLEAVGDNPVLLTETYTGEMGGIDERRPFHAVMASGWRAEDGTVGVAMMNISEQPRTVRVKIPAERAGQTEVRNWAVEPLTYLDAPEIEYSVAGEVLEVTLPAKTPVVFAAAAATENEDK